METDLFKYLEGTMSPEEKLAFEAEIASNPELQETIALYNAIDPVLGQDDPMDMVSEMVKTVHQNYLQQQRIQNLWKWGAVAASLVLLLGIVSLLTYSSQKLNLIYKNNFTCWEPRNIVRDQIKEQPGEVWLQAYQQKDYATVTRTFTQLTPEQQMSLQFRLMQVSALMEQEKYEQALKFLDETDLHDFTFYKADITWYRALCYLKIDKAEQALSLFRQLEKNKKYEEKARRIIKRLD